jgi:hypothetical protein
MVEHQHKSHRQRMSPNGILQDCSSDSEDDEPPSTPQHSAMTWSPCGIVSMDQAIMHGPLHHATSYADFNQQVHAQHMPQQYANQHGIPSNVSEEFHGRPIPDYYASTSTPRPTTTMPRQMYYVTERGNPGVVTITNTAQPHRQLPQRVERPSIELSYSTSTFATSIQSSPRAFSTTSVSSPMVLECVYAYQPESQPEYAQVDSQQSIVQCRQPLQHLVSQSQQSLTCQVQPSHAPVAECSPQKFVLGQQQQW